MNKKLKPIKCRECHEEFLRWNSTQVCCSPDCALKYIKRRNQQSLQRDISNKQKKDRAELRKRKEALKSRSDLIKEAQIEFNKYIRERDKNEPCISCGKDGLSNNVYGGLWDCGHYRSVGSCPELRFNPLNAARQCVRCNRDLSGNVVEYRIGLVLRIGEAKIAWLEGPHQAQKWSIDEIKEIKAYYKEQLKLLRESNE